MLEGSNRGNRRHHEPAAQCVAGQRVRVVNGDVPVPVSGGARACGAGAGV